MMPKKIVDGIDLDTGEIVGEFNVNSPGISIEEITESPESKSIEERTRLLRLLFNDRQWHFDSAETGFVVYRIHNWHSGVTCPIVIRFEFDTRSLIVSSPICNTKRSIRLSSVVNMDDYIVDYKLNGGKRTIQENKKVYAAYKTTHTFKIKALELATLVGGMLQQRIYKIIMVAKIDVLLYTRLDPRVIMGESLIEKIIARGYGYVITERDNNKLIYMYQSLLEENDVDEILALIQQIK